ncbi:MAG: ATP-binding cassette domain-containing protein [Planctomycetes bacterium]|nr:ATP-binding cassette domain-containing protein [Planctomycetota bacterium]
MGRGLRFVAEQLSVRFCALEALSGVDLTIDGGERVAFVGPSGAGKTTLLRALGASLMPSSGRVEVGGVDVGRCGVKEGRQLRASIGFVPQDHALVPNVRVVQNVVAGRVGTRSFLGSVRDYAWPSRATLDEVHSLLDRVGIEDKLFERTDRLSGGQRQRVAIARALYQRPLAILADEPVASVDPSRARAVLELLTGISREGGLTLCASLHNVDYAREFFDRVVGLRAGKVVFDSRTDELDDARLGKLYALSADELLADGC